MRRSLAGLIAVGLAAAVLSGPGPVLANHEAPRFGLTPVGQPGTYFQLTMEPGETRELAVEVANFGHDLAVARTYAADAYSIVNGGFGAELFGEEASATTLWVDYETQEVTLPPREALVVEFRVTVPEDAGPGDYLTSLVVENAQPYGGAAEGEVGFQQVNRSAIAIAIDVPGPRLPSIQVGGVSHHVAGDSSVVTFEIANDGNVHLEPSAEFALRDATGTEIAAATLAVGTVYAGTVTTIEAPLAATLLPGDYCSELSLEDADTGANDESGCVGFTVAAPATEQPAGGGLSLPGIEVLQPAIESVTGNPLLASLLVLGMLVLTTVAVILFLRRRGRNRA